jgi:hypothetical protein
VLPATEAFRVVDDAITRDGRTVRPHLDWLLDHATPAGRAYGGVLLQRLDPAAAQAVWQRLSTDQSQITTFVGCVMNRETLADFATNQLG